MAQGGPAPLALAARHRDRYVGSVLRALAFTCLLPACVLLAAPSLARADCEVRGVASIDRIRLRLPGHALRTLSVTDLPVAVRPGHGSRYVDLRVLAPLDFGARTDAIMPWAIPLASAQAGGTLWLTPRVHVETVREQLSDDGLVIRARLDEGVWVERVHVPCDAVALGHGEGSSEPPDWSAQRGPSWALARPEVWVSAAPHEGASFRLEAPDGLPAPLAEVGRRGDWVRVSSAFSTGAALRGWIRQADLRRLAAPLPPPVPFERARSRPARPLCRRRPPPRRDEYVGPAHIATGAIITTRADGETAWATVSEPAVFTISWRTGSSWARVVHVPGLHGDGDCPEVLHEAYVPRQAVSLQGEGRLRGSTAPAVLLGLE